MNMISTYSMYTVDSEPFAIVLDATYSMATELG